MDTKKTTTSSNYDAIKSSNQNIKNNNTIIKCTKIIYFVAGHRIKNHAGKCKNLHGHQYKIEITFATQKLNDLNMVFDNSKINDHI